MHKSYTTTTGGHKARKRFGQNFLIDTKIIDRIVATIAPKAGDDLLEIGPGQGAMTLPLLEKLNQLHVINRLKFVLVLVEILNNFLEFCGVVQRQP